MTDAEQLDLLRLTRKLCGSPYVPPSSSFGLSRANDLELVLGHHVCLGYICLGCPPAIWCPGGLGYDMEHNI